MNVAKNSHVAALAKAATAVRTQVFGDYAMGFITADEAKEQLAVIAPLEEEVKKALYHDYLEKQGLAVVEFANE